MRLLKKLYQHKLLRYPLYALCLLLILAALDLALVQFLRRITLSPETTFITSPINPARTPDYTQAFNLRFSQNVTPDNNAAIPLITVGGTQEMPEGWRNAALAMLHLPTAGTPSLQQAYERWHMDRDPSIKKRAPDARDEQADKDSDTMLHAPWKSADHPEWSQWLVTQARPLELLHDAAARPIYFVPLFPSSGSTDQPGAGLSSLLPSLGYTRLLTNTALADAMRCAGDNDDDAFLARIREVHAVGKLLTARPIAIECLVGIAIQRTAYRACADRAQLPLNPTSAQKLFDALSALQPTTDISGTADIGERYAHLDFACFGATYGIHSRLDPGSMIPPELSGRLKDAFIPLSFNSYLRATNTYFDAATAALRLPTFQERRRALQALEASPDAASFQELRHLLRENFGGDSNDQFKLPNVESQRQSAATLRDLTRLALALHLYKSQHTTYPSSLQDLAPFFPQGLPTDGFTDALPLYLHTPASTTLYSVGPDLTDNHADPKSDLVITLPQ